MPSVRLCKLITDDSDKWPQLIILLILLLLAALCSRSHNLLNHSRNSLPPVEPKVWEPSSHKSANSTRLIGWIQSTFSQASSITQTLISSTHLWLGFPSGSLLQVFRGECCIKLSRLLSELHALPISSYWCYHPNAIWWRVNTMKLLIMQVLPFSSCPRPPLHANIQYRLWHCIFTHSDFTHIQFMLFIISYSFLAE